MIKTYLEKVKPVKAIQFTGDNLEDIKAAAYVEMKLPDVDFAEIDWVQKGKAEVEIYVPDGHINLYKSDWVIISPNYMKKMSNTEFENRYEQVFADTENNIKYG